MYTTAKRLHVYSYMHTLCGVCVEAVHVLPYSSGLENVGATNIKPSNELGILFGQ